MKRDRLILGNQKIHGVLLFDLPAIETCLNCSLCRKFCYAAKAERLYCWVKGRRLDNLYLVEKTPKLFRESIVEQLGRTKVKVVRLHSSGDFFSQRYVDIWTEIVALFPKKKFYAHTKSDKALNFKRLISLGNFNLIPSIIDGKYPNFGPIGYIRWLSEKYSMTICPGGVGSMVQCGVDCKICQTKKNVVFRIH